MSYNLIFNEKKHTCNCGNDTFTCIPQFGMGLEMKCCQCGKIKFLRDGGTSARYCRNPEPDDNDTSAPDSKQVTKQETVLRRVLYNIIIIIIFIIIIIIISLGSVWLTWHFRHWFFNHAWSFWMIDIIFFISVLIQDNAYWEGNTAREKYWILPSIVTLIMVGILTFPSNLWNIFVFILVGTVLMAFSKDPGVGDQRYRR